MKNQIPRPIGGDTCPPRRRRGYSPPNCEDMKPTLQLFYDSGLQKGIAPEEEAITYHGDVSSILGLVKAAVGAVACYGTGHLCCLPAESATAPMH